MKRTRGAVSKKDAKAIIVYFPLNTLPILDQAVRDADTDRSKFIRNAVREKLARSAAA